MSLTAQGCTHQLSLGLFSAGGVTADHAAGLFLQVLCEQGRRGPEHVCVARLEEGRIEISMSTLQKSIHGSMLLPAAPSSSQPPWEAVSCISRAVNPSPLGISPTAQPHQHQPLPSSSAPRGTRRARCKLHDRLPLQR